MTRFDSPRLVQYGGLAAVGLLAGLVLGRVELVAVAAPFALACVAGAALARHPEITATLELGRERALEGEDVPATITLSSPVGADRVDVYLPLHGELRAPGRNPRAVRSERRTSRIALELSLHCVRWGAFRLGPALVRARDRLGFHSWEAAGRHRPAAARVPERRDGSHDARAARDAGLRRQPGLAGARRRHRVRGPARVGAGRPRARASTGGRARAAACSG